MCVLPKLEFHGDFDEHVNGRPETPRRRESPLPHGIDRPAIQPGAQAAEDGHMANGAVSAHYDFEHDVSFVPGPASLFGVLRFHLPQQARRRNPAARTKRTAARSPTFAGADPGTLALAHSSARAGAGTALGP